MAERFEVDFRAHADVWRQALDDVSAAANESARASAKLAQARDYEWECRARFMRFVSDKAGLLAPELIDLVSVRAKPDTGD